MPGTETHKATGMEGNLPGHVQAALHALDEHKGTATVVLDMRGISGFTDFMILSTGGSERHAQALADAVEEDLRGSGTRPAHIEGRQQGRWVLLDYIDLIVHVFTPEAREFYQLERLWRDAPMLEWSPDETA